ncbi:MAG TPA: hypothetical protein VGZ26_00755 [Pirellulales bacterium]|jgi:hypothetical protein|nr:hypothetical protein [Pirellulales bacterium]
MQCEEFEDRLNAVLDERQRPEADVELRLHCEACLDCRQLAAAYARLLDGFYALAAPEPAGDIAVRVLADLQPPLSSPRRFAVATMSLAAAAGLLIAVMPLVRSERRASKVWLPTASAATSKQAGSHAAGSLESLDVNQLPIVPELLALRTTDEDPYAGLAKETGQGLATVVLYVPGIGGSKGIVDASGSDDPAWAVQMSEGLKPITDSVAETVNLLLRALPDAVSDTRS